MQASSVFAGSRCCDRCSSIVSALLALLLAATTSSVGCSQKQRELAPLTGKVIYNGEPLQFGTVMIEHKYGQPASAVIQPDGTFAMATRAKATERPQERVAFVLRAMKGKIL